MFVIIFCIDKRCGIMNNCAFNLLKKNYTKYWMTFSVHLFLYASIYYIRGYSSNSFKFSLEIIPYLIFFHTFFYKQEKIIHLLSSALPTCSTHRAVLTTERSTNKRSFSIFTLSLFKSFLVVFPLVVVSCSLREHTHTYTLNELFLLFRIPSLQSYITAL